MFKPTLKNNRNLQSQQVLNALIAVVHPYLPLDLQNTRITADDIIAVLGYASAETDRIAPIKWLMALKYSLLSGAEMSGSRGGFCMGGSIIHSMPFDLDFIRAEIGNQSYQISNHADDERLADGIDHCRIGNGALGL